MNLLSGKPLSFIVLAFFAGAFVNLENIVPMFSIWAAVITILLPFIIISAALYLYLLGRIKKLEEKK